MASEHEKGKRELAVFHHFLLASHLPIDQCSVKKYSPPHPDILCRHLTEGEVAFELVELCDPNLAKSIATASEGYLRTSDPSPKILSKKLRRKYNSTAPVELLCYTAGRIITPDDVILPTIKPYLSSWRHVFRRVWLLGSKGVYIVWATDKD